MEEEWRPIPGTDGCYEVSSLGRARSLPRFAPVAHSLVGHYLRPVPGQVLSTHKLKNGYWAVSVVCDGRSIKKYIHRLLMEAFGPPKPFPRAVVRHWDDNKDHNSLDNLRWGNHQDNTTDALFNGRIPVGNQCHRAKLNYEIVEQIRRCVADGASQRVVAMQFGTDQSMVSRIMSGALWDPNKYVNRDQERMATAAIVRLQARKR